MKLTQWILQDSPCGGGSETFLPMDLLSFFVAQNPSDAPSVHRLKLLT